ncbi:MAG: hypothetical protein IJ774_11215 [Selenomonadaceae bacterium]|nr:hypothetical protein [Selenomonadaceae bacterium]
MTKKILAIFFAAAIFFNCSGGGSWGSDNGGGGSWGSDNGGGGSWGSDMESQYYSDYDSDNGGSGRF